MTVEELKAVLEEMPNDCVVKVFDFDGEYADIVKIRICKTYYKEGSNEIVELHY